MSSLCGLCNERVKWIGAYKNIPGANKAEPFFHLGYSGHISVMPMLAYRLLVRLKTLVLKQVIIRIVLSTLTVRCSGRLKGDNTSLKDDMSSMTGFITKCIDDITVSKTITFK